MNMPMISLDANEVLRYRQFIEQAIAGQVQGIVNASRKFDLEGGDYELYAHARVQIEGSEDGVLSTLRVKKGGDGGELLLIDPSSRDIRAAVEVVSEGLGIDLTARKAEEQQTVIAEIGYRPRKRAAGQ